MLGSLRRSIDAGPPGLVRLSFQIRFTVQNKAKLLVHRIHLFDNLVCCWSALVHGLHQVDQPLLLRSRGSKLFYHLKRVFGAFRQLSNPADNRL